MQSIIDSLPGLVAVAIVDIDSGMSLASHANSPALNPDTTAAYNTQVVNEEEGHAGAQADRPDYRAYPHHPH